MTMTGFSTKTFLIAAALTGLATSGLSTSAFAQAATPWELKTDMAYAYDKAGKTFAYKMGTSNAGTLLKGAKKPMIMMGRVSRSVDNWNKRVQLAEALEARVCTNLKIGAAFPTDHLERVLAGARDGVRFLSHEVFDGWGFDALTQITSVIGQAKEVRPLAGAAADAPAERAWPVSMAYYGVEDPADTPEFEASFLLVENGVLRELVLDYGDFILDATLEKLELLERPEC